DGRVPLEESVSGRALLREARRLVPQADAATVFARAPHDPRMAELLAGFATELAFHVVNLAIAIDPQRIVVGGGMVRSWDQLYGGLRGALDAAVPYPPELRLAAFPFDAPLLGALALGLAATAELQPAGTETRHE
ncbi:MAG TPA: ROK family protein, partial [Rugosimonospora sp.]|nr:ROK family protein [Rugosimonospora sp.]